MASLSLPRVLQLKKNSLDAEREQFEKFQTLAIQKAINSIETPVKEKHVRSTIIGTFQEQSAITYWMVAIRLPIQDNRIVAWKFCHVTHKLLREGHPACLDDSQRHINMIENLGKLWVHLREGYGRLVHLYCTLLVCKLKFHARNPRFPGNMQLTADELDAIAENDINNYFQLCVELFDYMDDILNLQAAVFDSLGNARANSMTASGQCRLAALIPCAQDASHIYDCNVRLLFRLHASLPPDTLAGHRERFRQQFKKLSSFYKHASSLQYYRNLLTLPVLPSNPPNFLLQSDFGTYVTPVVSIPEPPPDEVDAVGSLIDTSDTISQATTPDHLDVLDTRTTPSPQPDPVVERDRLIDHLQNELKRMRLEVSQLVQERNTMLGSMREHCTRIESQLHTTKNELEEERQKAQVLLAQAPEIKKKLTETEEKAKVTDEKFQKLKGAYTQLREEHITLIRQKAEVDKMASSLRAAAAQQESAKMLLQQQLNDRMKDVELLQQSTSSSEEVEAYKSELANLRSELENSRQKDAELETLKLSMEALEIEHKTAMTEQEEKLTVVSGELKEATESLQKIKQEKEERDEELKKIKEELVGLRQKSGEEYKKAVEEKEAALKEVTELKQQHVNEKEEQIQYTNNLRAEIESLNQKLSEAEARVSVESELNNKRKEIEESIKSKEIEIKDINEKLEMVKGELITNQVNYDKILQEKEEVISNLQKNLAELDVNHNVLNESVTKLQTEIDDLKTKNYEGQQYVEEANTKINLLNDEVSHLKKSCEEKDIKLKELQQINDEFIEIKKNQSSNNDELTNTKSVLQRVVKEKENEICDLKMQLQDIIETRQKERKEFEECKKESNIEVTILKDKLQNVISCKDELINDLKSMISEKDSQVITLNVEVNKVSEELLRLKEELCETRAELEIGQNELLNLKDEHDAIIDRNESNLALKNQELRSLLDEIKQIREEKSEILADSEKLISKLVADKQVLEKNIKELEETQKQLYTDMEATAFDQSEIENKLNSEIERLKAECEKLRNEKDNEVDNLTDKINEIETEHNEQIIAKDNLITKTMQSFEELKNKLDEVEKVRAEEKEEMVLQMSEKEKYYQRIVARLEHTDESRLTAECELQDLLQHNTALESDVASLRIQLEEAQLEIKKQRSRLVGCAGEAALEVTSCALAAAEHSSSHDANTLAAERAARALDLLSSHEVQGNEESVAKSAIFLAHNTAQLAAYATEVSNISTDMEAADKLNSECKSMLTATKQCLEWVRGGGGGEGDRAAAATARARLSSVARAAAAADRAALARRCVDDELADMDRAIEDAAAQIEELLAASRAGDSGVKLEVNGKILDACTTLMGAVKALVQDSRSLQQELGDPTTRQKMYRKNPQWSEGLISAAKSVVFAAKLLVTSADEAVGSEGRVEGVSAAAHEVAGSTAQLVAASRARAPPQAASLARLTAASRAVAAATGAVVAAVRAAAALVRDREALDTSALTLTATRRLEMESKVRSLELESALDAERARLAALRKRHYTLAQLEENGNMTNGKE